MDNHLTNNQPDQPSQLPLALPGFPPERPSQVTPDVVIGQVAMAAASI